MNLERNPQPGDGARLVAGSGAGTVLLLSMRRVARQVAFCLQYEFEDVITEITGADRVDLGGLQALELSRRTYKLTRLATGSRALARALALRPSVVRLERDYELFFPVLNNAYELYALATVPDWRRRCRRGACFLNEVWVHLLPRYLLELLQPFDHVFVGTRQSVESLSRIVGRPCSYLPLAADVLTFSPLPELPPRVIDVCNIGRRSPVTHAALVRMARDRRMLYYYDSVAPSGPEQKQRTFLVEDPSEHRLLLASILQRSRYFVANRGRINEPEFTRGRDEISGRFYEGSAAGAVMLGEAPRTDEFERQFDWDDSIIHLPFHSPDVELLLADLDRDRPRLARVRQRNLRNAALRHDWSHRLRTVFEVLGIPPTAGMLDREARLQALGTMAEKVVPSADLPVSRDS